MNSSKYNASDLFIKALENEGVEYIFGIPGEENLYLLEALRKSKKIKLILNRHEQAAGFMAATYGRATGKVGVVLTTLGPGATNLTTAAAYAKLGGFPVVFITGQKPIRKSKQGQFQIIDVVDNMKPVVKYSKQVVCHTMVSSIVRESFRVALEEKTGPCHIEFPEDISELPVSEDEMNVFKISKIYENSPSEESVDAIANIISNAEFPLVLVGSSCNRDGISENLTNFVNQTGIRCISTQMGKGIISEDNPNFVGTCALSSNDYVHEVVAKADVIINIGYDVAEKPPYFVDFNKITVIHVNTYEAVVDNIYNPQHELIANINNSIKALSKKVTKGNWNYEDADKIRDFLKQDAKALENDTSFPMKPQKIVRDVSNLLASDGIVALDNGMYKLWFARSYETLKPNSFFLDNALATMGAGLPSAMEMARLYPNKKVLAVVGDGGFMMNSQEIETAVRLKLNLTILLLNDNAYGMIRWKQNANEMEDFGMTFQNPDFVAYAKSYGAMGYRVEKAEEFSKILEESFTKPGVKLIEVAIDYSENKKVFTEGLKNKVKVI